MKNRIPKVFMFVLAFGILTCSSACTQEQSGFVPDARKKEKVYNMYKNYKKDFPGVKDISPKQAMSQIPDKKLVFVDTRKAEEMKISMLPDAVSQDEFLSNPGKYKDYIIVTYCTISYRSGKLAEKLSNKGLNIYNLTGGILAWIHEGGRVFDKNGETQKVHVYGKKWNLVPEKFESVW